MTYARSQHLAQGRKRSCMTLQEVFLIIDADKGGVSSLLEIRLQSFESGTRFQLSDNDARLSLTVRRACL